MQGLLTDRLSPDRGISRYARLRKDALKRQKRGKRLFGPEMKGNGKTGLQPGEAALTPAYNSGSEPVILEESMY
jgi:hypothetical protein